MILGADAHPTRIAATLASKGYSANNPLKVDLFKLCHHGSKRNLSPELLTMLDCTRFAISTNGTRHGHPDAEAIARVLANDPERPKTLYFNSSHAQAGLWSDETLQVAWRYTCVYPDPLGKPGIDIDI